MIKTLGHPHHEAPNGLAQARCRNGDPDAMFVRGLTRQREAAALCKHCPIILQCGADALDNRVEFGVWGGMTECERRNLIKLHPRIDSWAAFISRAQRNARSRSASDATAPTGTARVG